MIRIVALLLVFVACKDKPAPSPAPAPPAPVVADASVVAPIKKSEVRTDKRIELVSIICRLAGFAEYTESADTSYLDDVDRWFAPYAKHKAVLLLRELRAKNNISHDAPMNFAIHLDDTLTLRNVSELAEIDDRWAGVDAAELANQVRKFAAIARLDPFLAKHATYFAGLARTLDGVVTKESPIPWFDQVFGSTEAEFVVVPSPILGSLNMGLNAKTPDGRQTFYQIIGAAGSTGEIVVDDELVDLLVHEMAHSYINHVFEAHRDALMPAGENIFALVEKTMSEQAYSDPMVMLQESGVRAVVVNYMRQRHGDASAARAARSQQRQGFLWINELAEVMRQLAKQREANASYDLEAHMPKIVAFFDDLAKQYEQGLPMMPFRGPVDAVHNRDPVWVVPTNAPVAAYARMIHAQLKKTSPVVVASKNTLVEQRGHDLVAYGTAADNPVVDFVMRSARWKISKDSIVLGDKAFTGPGLVLIACWYLRDDPSRGVAVYTAPDAANLVGVNSGVRHGPNDWLVARKQGGAFVILGAGDFPRGLDDMWMLPGEKPTAPPFPENPK